ncbi:19068_t:CDS:2, partial [Racocetra persica]
NFSQRLEAQKYTLSIERSYLIIQGSINIKDLFLQYNIDSKNLEDQKIELTNKAIKDIQLDIDFENAINNNNHETKNYEETFDRIDKTYTGIIQSLKDEISNISIPSWSNFKNRLLFAKHYAKGINQLSQDSESPVNISTSKVFHDKENNIRELIKKYTTKANNNGWTFFGLFKWLNNSAYEIMNKINDAKKIPDSEFAKQIFDLKDDNIASSFLKVYEEWR